jgi:hypothetical protein
MFAITLEEELMRLCVALLCWPSVRSRTFILAEYTLKPGLVSKLILSDLTQLRDFD